MRVLAAAAMIPVMCMPTVVYAQTSLKIGVAEVTGQALRLRSDGSYSASVLDYAEKGDMVVVLEKVGEWYRVNYNLQEGYMHESFLSFTDVENIELGYAKVCGDYVNLRKGPSTSYQSLGILAENEKVYIIGINDGWYKVISGDLIGYMRSDYLELMERPYENAGSANSPLFFKNGQWMVDSIDPSLLYSEIPEIPNDPVVATPEPIPEEVVIEDTVENDVSVEIAPEEETSAEDNNSAADVEIETEPEIETTPESTPDSETTTESETAEEPETPSESDEVLEEEVEVSEEPEIVPTNPFGEVILAKAQEYLGVPYVWGGTTPSGFDCSGFTYYVLNQVGLKSPRNMPGQYALGTPVEKDELLPGDIVFFENTYTTGLSHVGIYAGDGQFIHAPSAGRVVSYGDLNSAYNIAHYWGACRITG